MNYSRFISHAFWYHVHFLKQGKNGTDLIYGHSIVNYEPTPTSVFAFNSKNTFKASLSYSRKKSTSAARELFHSMSEVHHRSIYSTDTYYRNVAEKCAGLATYSLDNLQSSRELNKQQGHLFNSSNFNKNF